MNKVIGSSSSKAPTTKSRVKRAPKDTKRTPAPVMISDLCEEEKLKVTRLVEDLLVLGQQNEELKARLSNEKFVFESEMKKTKNQVEGNISIIEDQMKMKDDRILALETKESLIIGILSLYQEKLQKMSNHMRDSTKLEAIQKSRIAEL